MDKTKPTLFGQKIDPGSVNNRLYVFQETYIQETMSHSVEVKSRSVLHNYKLSYLLVKTLLSSAALDKCTRNCLNVQMKESVYAK